MYPILPDKPAFDQLLPLLCILTVQPGTAIYPLPNPNNLGQAEREGRDDPEPAVFLSTKEERMTRTNEPNAPKESAFKHSIFGIISLVLGLMELAYALAWAISASNHCSPPLTDSLPAGVGAALGEAILLGIPLGTISALIGRFRDQQKKISTLGAVLIVVSLCSFLMSLLVNAGNC